jgi:hypothetical protein
MRDILLGLVGMKFLVLRPPFSSAPSMTLFSVENSKSVISVLTSYGNRRTPHKMSGLGTYLVTISQVWYPTTYNLQKYSVLSTMYDVLLEVTGTGAFQRWTPQFWARDHGA